MCNQDILCHQDIIVLVNNPVFFKLAFDACCDVHLFLSGFVGECGRRGGYIEVTGFPEAVTEQILKLASINLCPNLSGQICCALMMNPPVEGEPSFALYDKVSTR